MSDESTTRLKAGNVIITNFPMSIVNENAEEGKKIVQFIRENYGEDAKVDYSDIVAEMAKGATPEPDILPPTEDIGQVPTDDFSGGALPKEDVMPPADARQTTLKGMWDAAFRESGPEALAAAGGFAVAGPPGAAAGLGIVETVDFLSPILTNFMNKHLGTEQVSTPELRQMMLDSLGMERADTPAEHTAAAAARGAEAAGGFLAGGQLLQTGRPVLGPGNVRQEVGRAMVANPAEQIVSGALSEAAATKGTQIAQERDMGPVGQVLLPLGFGILGDIAGTSLVKAAPKVYDMARAKWGDVDLPDAAAEAIRYSQGRGELFLDDLDPMTSERGRSFREATSQVQDLRYQRNQARKQAIYDTMDDMGIVEQEYFNRDIIDDFNAKRGEALNKWVDEKNEIIQGLSEGGLSGATSPDSIVNTSNTLQLIESRRAELAALDDRSLDSLINTLTNWEGSLDGKNLEQIEFLRKRLRNQFEDPNLASVRDDGSRLAKEVYDSLNEEMGNFIMDRGGQVAYDQWKTANTALAGMMDDFKVDSLSTLIKKGESNPETINRFLNSGDREMLENLYNGLTPAGRETVQSAIMTDIIKRSTDLGQISPNQFARELERNVGRRVFFDEAADAQLNGLQKWLELTYRDEALGMMGNPQLGGNIPGATTVINRGIRQNPALGLASALASKTFLGKFTKWLETGDARDMMIKYGKLQGDRRFDPDAIALAKRLRESYSAFMGATYQGATVREAIRPNPRLEAQAEWRAEESQIPQSTTTGISR